jgi:ABC-type transport system involved in multi-copper enzyme maturation permease subunit
MQETADDREKLLKRDVLLVATAGLSLLNGMHFSPLFDPVLFFVHRMAPSFFGPLLLFYFNSLLISLTTLLLAGVPAALSERVRGLKESTGMSLGIWLGGVLFLTLPSLLAAAGR